NGNREPLTNFLSWVPEKSVISWAWHSHAKYRTRYGDAAADPANAHLTFIRLTSRRDITRFLADPLHYAHPDHGTTPGHSVFTKFYGQKA
ncbi:MAG: adenylate kinase, partial [Actinomycetia bacterium]|nr:adenylate kinase [Actinomycetes bacterium]